MNFLLTVDVEDFSIPLNRCDPETAQQVYKVGLPRIISLLSKYDAKSTFYFTGEMCEHIPESVDLVQEHGHEIGCHGYTHSNDRALDILSFEEQLEEIKKAKAIIESVAGKIGSFRAPALRINEDTIRALEKTGFGTDSSVCSQRFDGPLTFGSRKKLKWLKAPRMPYYPSEKSIAKPGSSSVLEVPISAMISPYIGTTMRISPSLSKVLEKFIFSESRKTGKPVVFLFHPNECIDFDGRVVTTVRSKNPVKHFFAGYVRQRLKLKNLGMKSIHLLDGIMRCAKDHEFEFIEVSAFKRQFEGG